MLTGTLYYSLNLPSQGIDRGDAAGAILTSFLAATPDLSLLLGIDVANFSATTAGGTPVRDSERLSGIVNIGVATVLSRSVAASVTAGVGFTSAAPPFQLIVAFPVRL